MVARRINYLARPSMAAKSLCFENRRTTTTRDADMQPDSSLMRQRAGGAPDRPFDVVVIGSGGVMTRRLLVASPMLQRDLFATLRD